MLRDTIKIPAISADSAFAVGLSANSNDLLTDRNLMLRWDGQSPRGGTTAALVTGQPDRVQRHGG